MNAILEFYKSCQNSKLIEELENYFSGKIFSFSTCIKQKGTPFQEKVWDEVAKIPFGQTKSYAQIAENIGHLGAQRAVGTALNKNQLPIFVPCHRVINKNGNLGNYAFGADLKALLIEHEKKLCSKGTQKSL